VGPTLLVVNPFKNIKGMFEPEVRNKYAEHIVSAKGNPLAYKELQPHVYAVAAEAYRQLFENEKNQAIVISGESGAGKTENAKFCMNLLTSIGSLP
jgi:myosin heavy subunit